MAVEIHPSAIVDPEAELGENVRVEAFSVIGPQVQLGDGCVVHSHAVLNGPLKAGKENIFFHFCTVGVPPQDLTYKGELTEVVIGDHNTFREYVNIHRGTLKEEGITRIGSNNLLMTYVHVGHDVVLGSQCVIANSVNFAGHVCIQDRVIIGGGCNVAQFITLGRGCYIGGGSVVVKDIPPLCTAYGNRARLKGVNIIGMKRLGYSKSIIMEVIDFYRNMEASPLSPRSFVDDEQEMVDYKGNDLVEELCESIRKSEVGVAPFFTA